MSLWYIYTYIYIYICVKKHCHLLCWVYKKNDSFLSFHSSIFHSKIHKHPAFKMNRDEQGGAGQKFEAITWSQKICHYFCAFTFRCMNALALSLIPSISLNEPFLIKCLLWRVVLKNRMKTNRGRGEVTPTSMLTLWKKLPDFSNSK